MRDVASSANITDIFTNTLGGLATATYIITPYRNGCAGNPDTLIVTVGAEPFSILILISSPAAGSLLN